MKFFRKRKTNLNIESLTSPVITVNNDSNAIENLVELVKRIRPANYRNIKEAGRRFKAVLAQLQLNEPLLLSLREVFFLQFTNGNIVPAFTESGMVGSRGFLQELFIKIKHKILPPLLEDSNFLYVINHVFYKQTDYIWVQGIDKSLWIEFFELLGFKVNFNDASIVKQLNQSLHLICQRTVTLGLEKEMRNTLPGIEYQEYSFVKLDKALQNYLQLYEQNAAEEQVNESISKFIQILNDCHETIELISEQRRIKGTSLSQTYILLRIEQHLERMYLIADILDRAHRFNIERLLNYFIKIIFYEKKKNSLGEFISANFSFIAYQITEHGSKKGIHYITTTRKEFWQLIKSAMGGGLIISFTAVVKNLLTHVAMAPFWQGFAYSINYFIGFQLLSETGATLATKQPAFTASAIVNSFDTTKDKGHFDLYNVAITIARTIRSQIASFAGNLVIVFPFTYGLAALYFYITGTYIIEGNAAHKLLVEQHPLQSLSLLYACFTGFFLFVSGLIAGYVENHLNYGKVGERLRHHPVFKNTLLPGRLVKLTNYVEHNLGTLAGNLSLGFFLGMAGFIGKIFGLPFDVRHITISAGNTGIAFFAVGRYESLSFIITLFVGVLMIGFLNFLISFSLAFLVAARSRGVRLKDYPDLLLILGRFIRKYPADFIRPPKELRDPDDLKKFVLNVNLMFSTCIYYIGEKEL